MGILYIGYLIKSIKKGPFSSSILCEKEQVAKTILRICLIGWNGMESQRNGMSCDHIWLVCSNGMNHSIPSQTLVLISNHTKRQKAN